ncbi:unnamed protein product, partial [Adineta steineri]
MFLFSHFTARRQAIMDDYDQNKHFKFGKDNPTLMKKPFWTYMVCNPHLSAYDARKENNDDFSNDSNTSTWCFSRFGATQTYLPDGRLICIGGEHEDSYDPDFQIYNDVVVIRNPRMVRAHYMYSLPVPSNFPLETASKEGEILGTSKPEDVTIYGYPEHVFPPTDFHTATYVKNNGQEDFIYIIGDESMDERLQSNFSTNLNESSLHRKQDSDSTVHDILSNSATSNHEKQSGDSLAGLLNNNNNIQQDITRMPTFQQQQQQQQQVQMNRSKTNQVLLNSETIQQQHYDFIKKYKS